MDRDLRGREFRGLSQCVGGAVGAKRGRDDVGDHRRDDGKVNCGFVSQYWRGGKGNSLFSGNSSSFGSYAVSIS